MTKQEFFKAIKEQVEGGIIKVDELTKESNSLAKLARSGNYAGEKLRNIKDKEITTRGAIDTERENRNRAIAQICDEYIEELRSQDDLNPADINEGDLKLLTCGIHLTDRDLKAMVKRNEGNRTMIQLIQRHIQADNDRDLDIGLVYEGNKGMVDSVSNFPTLTKSILEYSDGMEGNAGFMFNEIFGENADIASKFSDNE